MRTTRESSGNCSPSDATRSIPRTTSARARAFTGITLFRESEQDARPIYDLLNHDETDKAIFSGRAGSSNYNYLSVIDLTLEQPEASQYVARNLFVYFIHDEPSDAVVRDLANTFRNADFDIKTLVRTILSSQAMFSQQARSTHVTTPVDHVIGLARTLDIHMNSEESQTGVLDQLARDLRDAGHELLNPPGVRRNDNSEGESNDPLYSNRVGGNDPLCSN